MNCKELAVRYCYWNVVFASALVFATERGFYMLILSRRCGEAIVIDERVTITVLSIKGRQVRIGIDAPDDVNVHREEIYQRIMAGEDTGYGSDAANAESGDAEPGNTKPDNSAKLVGDESVNDTSIKAANEDTNISAEK